MADFPDICPDDETLGLEANNQIFESVLTGQTQTAQLTGDKWTAQPSFSNRYGAEAKTLQAFIFGLGGTRGTFNYSPFSIDQQGTMSGNGVVDGAGQTGSVLNTKGWDINQADLFKIGDYLSFNGELKLVTADASSDGAGNASISIAPPIRVSPSDNNAIETTKPFFVGRLEDDDQTRVSVSSPIIYNSTLSIKEAF